MSNVLETKKQRLTRIMEEHTQTVSEQGLVITELNYSDFLFLVAEAMETSSYRDQVHYLDRRVKSDNEDLMATLKHLQAENKYLKNELKKKPKD